MLHIGERSIVRCGHQDKFYKKTSFNQLNNLRKKKKDKLSRNAKEYEPSSKPKDDICGVYGLIFAIIYISLGFKVTGVRILLLIVQHSPIIKQSVIDPR